MFCLLCEPFKPSVVYFCCHPHIYILSIFLIYCNISHKYEWKRIRENKSMFGVVKNMVKNNAQKYHWKFSQLPENKWSYAHRCIKDTKTRNRSEHTQNNWGKKTTISLKWFVLGLKNKQTKNIPISALPWISYKFIINALCWLICCQYAHRKWVVYFKDKVWNGKVVLVTWKLFFCSDFHLFDLNCQSSLLSFRSVANFSTEG